MRLRNKQTGKMYDSDKITLVIYGGEYGEVEENYLSIAELNQDWEEIKPKEPLIKDEKIRKAVRAWAEALNIEYAEIIHDGSNCEVASYFCGLSIEFDETTIDIKDGHYTIAELCGEKKE